MPWRGWRENPLLHQLKQSWHQLVRTSKVCGDLLHWAVRWLCNSLVSVWLMKMSWGHNNVANLISFSSMREASRWTRQSSLAGDALPLKTGFSLRSLKYSVRQQFSTTVGITWKASRSAHPIPWEHQWLWFTYSRSQPGWRTTALRPVPSTSHPLRASMTLIHLFKITAWVKNHGLRPVPSTSSTFSPKHLNPWVIHRSPSRDTGGQARLPAPLLTGCGPWMGLGVFPCSIRGVIYFSPRFISL